MKENKKENKSFSSLKGIHKAIPIILVAAAIFIGVCLISSGMGPVGGAIRAVLSGLFSSGAFIIPIAMIVQALCYAVDLEDKKIKARTLFSSVALILASCVDYAIFSWNTEAAFSPVANFINMNNGGFIGGIIGFLLTKLLGNLGAIIFSVLIIAIYAVFFFGEKAGSLGRAAIRFTEKAKQIIAAIKDKRAEKAEKKRQLKEDAEQHQREMTSAELIDDEFFQAKGNSSSVKIKKLGIEENESTHGLSPLVDPEKRIPEDEPEIVTPEPERKRRKSDKPVDLSYGMEEDKSAEEVFATQEKKPKSEKAFFGIDESADSVFTNDFDPFDFATSEKRAAKYASKVAVNSAVTEEIDEMTLYEMRANHEPTEEEIRRMKFEERKKALLKKMEATRSSGSAPASTPAPVPSPAPQREEVVSQPAPVESAPAPVVEKPITPAPAPAPASEQSTPSTPASRPSSYSPARATYTPPVKTVEFTVSKSPAPVAETKPVSPTVSEAKNENEAEDVAILISERLARSTPGYARSANDLKTYTTVVSSDDDELYRQLQGLDAPISQPSPVEAPAAAPIVERAPEVAPTESYEEVAEESYVQEPVVESYDENVEPVYAPARDVEFSVGNEDAIVEPTAQSTYQRAAGFASSMVNEPVATPEFKPYTPPVAPIHTPTVDEVADENVLKVERSMLPPTHEAVFNEAPVVDKSPSPEAEPISLLEKTVASAEVDFAPADDETDDEIDFAKVDEAESSTVAVSLFDVADDETDEDSEPAVEEEDDGVEISFDEDDEEDNEDTEDDYSDDGDLDDSEDGDGSSEEDPDGEADEDYGADEIPPEEQNPDVIKMREMFPCLTPIGEQKTTSRPAAEAKAEVTLPAEEEEDEIPFDDAVEVAPAATSLVPMAEVKEEKKKKNKPDYSNYQFPPLDLLAKQEDLCDDNIAAETQENADRLIETLASFGVTASTKGVDRGPRITRYEVVPAKGVKVSSILNLESDIALNLAAGSIRMEAPIPGKSAVGIEIPNKKSSIVRLRDLLETPDFQSSKSKTLACIGRDVAGQPVFGDLASMPHLLIAGATGMGKSVCINALLVSVLYKAKPDEVKLIMIDPKQVEFTMYNGIPHLLVPVVSDPKQAAGSLLWAVEEMERRYNLLQALCVRNIDAYNTKVNADPSLGEPMPKIIIVIDEFADLMLQVKDPVENLVTRIAQKARAAGIHLIIGTQRPSVNVITGVIKANIPSRMSCKVMSIVDSKTILDSSGAEKLLDKGDSLYAPAGSPKPHRLQCAFVSDAEVESIMDYLRQYSDGDTYDATIMEDMERAAQRCSKKGGDRDDDDGADAGGEGYLNDRQFLDAVDIAVNSRKISTSLIQRKMSIGYGKAAKFIDIMEGMGIVGPANRQRPREVLMSPDEWREKQARTTYD